jgi:hypothetical protein
VRVLAVAALAALAAQGDDDCGLASYPVARTTAEILAAAPRGDAPSSTMVAKLAVDTEGRIEQL